MNLDFNGICRLCLRFSEKYVDLKQTNGAKSLSKELAEKIRFCYLIQMDLSDGLPTKVCYECIQVISFFYIAKKNVVFSEQLLRDVFYVREKLKNAAGIHEEKNKSGSDIVQAVQEKQKPSRSLLAINCKSQDIINSNGINHSNSCKSNNTSNIDLSKDKSVSSCSAAIVTNNLKPNSDFKIKIKRKKKKKKFKHVKTHASQVNELQKPSNMPESKSNSLKFKASKILRSQLKRKTNSFKGSTSEKGVPEPDTSLGEYIFKEIGTVIDTSNILSPDVKRTRKTVLAK